MGMARTRGERDNKAGSDEYFKFMGRLLRNYATKATKGEVDRTSLTQLRELRELLDAQTTEVVRILREEHGYSWAEVADGLGIDRNNAARKYGRKVETVELP